MREGLTDFIVKTALIVATALVVAALGFDVCAVAFDHMKGGS
jgi:hypothetical protein